jgi:alpha-glucosidase (family GH31 glycosyl hydrolase)
VTLERSGFILLNPHPHVYFDFGYTDSGQWSVDIPGGPIDMIVIARPTPREWTSLLHETTGRPPLPRPQWLGTWFSWAGYSSSDEYIEWIRRFVDANIPLDVWALDLHWRGGKIFEEDEGGDGFNLDWEPNTFGTHGELMSVLDQHGIDAVLHVNTRMYSGELATEGRRREFLRDATEHQWVVDLEDPAAQTWAWGPYAERVADGVTGWWIDNSERVEGTLSSGIPARNFYSSLWNRFLTAHVREETGEPVLTLTRGGWLGDQTAALPWSGDTTAGVSRVKEDLNFVLNLAMTGFPFSSVDLGGFKEQKPSGKGIIDTDENVLRRIAHGFLYMPVPRLHGGLLTAPKLPWRYAPEVSELLISFIRLRHRLAPTYYSAAIDAVEHAVPLVRPLLFDFPDDQDAIRIFDEVLVGRSLLVAPVTDEGWSERDVYLPEGDWFDYWSGSHLAGGRSHRVDAPLYERSGLPIFVRSGGMLAYRPLSSPREGFSELTVALYRRLSVPASAQSCELPAQEFRTPDGSSLTVDVSGDELTLTTSGTQEWSVSFEFPVSDAAPRQSIGGTPVDGPLRLPPAGRTCVALDWDTDR